MSLVLGAQRVSVVRILQGFSALLGLVLGPHGQGRAFGLHRTM